MKLLRAEPKKNAAMPPRDHESLLRRSFNVARRAHTYRQSPFGALLMNAAGDMLLEVENGFMPDRDMTGHAERLLSGSSPPRHQKIRAESPRRLHALHVGRAVRNVRRRDLWGRHRPRCLRLVRTPPEDADRQSRREPEARSALPHRVRCRQRHVEVIGPLLEDEAAALHDGVWQASSE